MTEWTTLTGTTHVKWLDDAYVIPAEDRCEGTWIAEDDRFPGAWAEGDTAQSALDRLCSVIRDWWYLKVRDGDDDLPPCHLTFSSAIGGSE